MCNIPCALNVLCLWFTGAPGVLQRRSPSPSPNLSPSPRVSPSPRRGLQRKRQPLPPQLRLLQQQLQLLLPPLLPQHKFSIFITAMIKTRKENNSSKTRSLFYWWAFKYEQAKYRIRVQYTRKCFTISYFSYQYSIILLLQRLGFTKYEYNYHILGQVRE